LYSSSPAKEQIYDLASGVRSVLQDSNNFLFPATYNGLLAGKNSNGSNVTALNYLSVPSPFAGASQLSMLAFFMFFLTLPAPSLGVRIGPALGMAQVSRHCLDSLRAILFV
jgi:hypothetical protein